MPKPKQFRWVCPNCGAGKLAPSRPRKDDVRRYCLACSERTGRLVERLSPALEKQRREAKEKRKRAAKQKRVKTYREAALERRQEREAALGLPKPLSYYIRRFARLKVWKDAPSCCAGKVWGPMSGVKVKIRWGETSGSSGHAKQGWWFVGDGTQITLTVGKNATAAGVLELLLHEFAHHASYRLCPVMVQEGRWHGEEFKSLLIRACEELTGQDVDAVVDGGHCYETVDPACKEAIKAWLEALTSSE